MISLLLFPLCYTERYLELQKCVSYQEFQRTVYMPLPARTRPKFHKAYLGVLPSLPAGLQRVTTVRFPTKKKEVCCF